MSGREVFLVDGARTPFLKVRGKRGPFTPVDLAVQCGRPLLARQPVAPEAFDMVILGCVNVIADEMNPARVAALRMGMGDAMVAFTVQINCGSPQAPCAAHCAAMPEAGRGYSVTSLPLARLSQCPAQAIAPNNQ